MVITQNVLTLTLLTAFGGYFVAAGIAVLTGPHQVEKMLAEFQAQPALTYIAGVIVYALGVAVVAVHNSWTDFAAGFVSLIGWVMLIEGLVLLAFPKALLQFSETFVQPGWLKAIAVIILAGGVVLILLGVLGQAG